MNTHETPVATQLSFDEYCIQNEIDPDATASIGVYTTALAANYQIVNPTPWLVAPDDQLITQSHNEASAA